MQIGLEIGDAPTVALLVGDDGKVAARAGADAGADAGAVVRAVRVVKGAAAGETAIGIASPIPDSPRVHAVASALKQEGLCVGAIRQAGAAAAYAEWWIGAAKGASDVVYFSIADHAMGGIVRGGVPLDGARGRAASISWLALNPVEREDYRKVGCLEAEVSASGIVRRLVWRIKAGDHSQVQDEVGDDLSAITIDHVLRAARDGDGLSISVVRDTAKYIGMAAGNVVVIIDPDVLVFGGIVASSADLLALVRVELSRRLPRSMMDALSIVQAALGSDAAAIGAARLASARLQ